MHKIDLNSFSEAELRELNREICDRIDLIVSMRKKAQLRAFRTGDQVVFGPNGNEVYGTIVRLNQKTASIEGNDGRQWRVSPGSLTKVARSASLQEEKQTDLFKFPMR